MNPASGSPDAPERTAGTHLECHAPAITGAAGLADCLTFATG